MIRAARIVVAWGLFVPALGAAQDPQPKPPAIKQISPQTRIPTQEALAADVVLSARLEQPQAWSRTFRIGSVTWSCRGETCTTTELSTGISILNACQALREQMGPIAAFGDGQRQLNPTELRQCNRSPQKQLADNVDLPPAGRLPADLKDLPGADQAGEPKKKVPIEGPATPPESLSARVDPSNLRPIDISPRHPEIVPGAELAIIDVRRAAGAGEPLHLNEVVSVGVVVRNTGERAATVRAGTAGNPRRDGGLIRYGAPRTISPGGTLNLPLTLVAEGGRVSGDHFETMVFLFHPASPGDDRSLGEQLFRDLNNADNEYRVRFPIDLPRTFNVVATLDELRVLDDCDNVSKGDWIVSFALTEFRGRSVAQSDATYWPSRSHASNVDSGSDVPINRTLRLTNVGEESILRVEVSAVDCDSNSPFLWGVAPGPWPAAQGVECNGEELIEASGDNDDAGVQFFELGPAEWQGDLPATLALTAYSRHACSDSPSHAFIPTLRLEVAP